MVDKKTLSGLELFIDLPDRALSRRLATLRRHLLQMIIDCERPASSTPEN